MIRYIAYLFEHSAMRTTPVKKKSGQRYKSYKMQQCYAILLKVLKALLPCQLALQEGQEAVEDHQGQGLVVATACLQRSYKVLYQHL